jgi:23S rRNA pseudouridine2605 synthase
MRLNRFLAASGVASRRGAEKLVLEGRVRVNGQPVLDLATFVEPGVDRVEVDGRRVSPPTTYTYLLLHKPEGLLTTARDPHGRPTVMELVPRRPRVFAVGRLDQETTGALLFTDDGALAHAMLHPRYKLEKEYEAVVEGAVPEDTLEQLRRGILLEGERRPTAPAEVSVVERRPGRTRLRLVLREGRKRQVRRMLEQVGHPVLQLCRWRIGPVDLGDLVPGMCRPLTEAEVKALRSAVQGAPGRRSRGRSSGGRGRRKE